MGFTFPGTSCKRDVQSKFLEQVADLSLYDYADRILAGICDSELTTYLKDIIPDRFITQGPLEGLLSRGINPNNRVRCGSVWTVYMEALVDPHSDLDKERSKELVGTMIALGADVFAKHRAPGIILGLEVDTMRMIPAYRALKILFPDEYKSLLSKAPASLRVRRYSRAMGEAIEHTAGVVKNIFHPRRHKSSR